MRVISGSARGRKLKMVPGETTRPVMDRVKESLFNIIGNRVENSHWLDLFAGTGQVGIEALSRGATTVVFIDNSRAAVRTIHDNLRATRLADRASVIPADAFAYLRQHDDGRQPLFDFIYVAPPQYKDLWRTALGLIAARPAAFLSPGGQVIIQIDPQEYDEERFPHLMLVDQRRYGRTLLCFYEASTGEWLDKTLD